MDRRKYIFFDLGERKNEKPKFDSVSSHPLHKFSFGRLQLVISRTASGDIRNKAMGGSLKTASAVVNSICEKAKLTGGTITKGGWCIKEAVAHILSADSTGKLRPILEEKGLPRMYSVFEKPFSSDREPHGCFRSLCRIVAGQGVSVQTQKSVWDKLNHAVNPLTPNSVTKISELEKETMDHLRESAGLSSGKAKAIVGLAKAFEDNSVSEAFLTNPATTEEEIRSRLLSIKGVGPWTCDMFMMVSLEKPNVMPLGDLGVRKGIQKFFALKAAKKSAGLDHNNAKDKAAMEDAMAPFYPYRSLISYYMWVVTDTKMWEPEQAAANTKRKSQTTSIIQAADTSGGAPATPMKTRAGKRQRIVVTP